MGVLLILDGCYVDFGWVTWRYWMGVLETFHSFPWDIS